MIKHALFDGMSRLSYYFIKCGFGKIKGPKPSVARPRHLQQARCARKGVDWIQLHALIFARHDSSDNTGTSPNFLSWSTKRKNAIFSKQRWWCCPIFSQSTRNPLAWISWDAMCQPIDRAALGMMWKKSFGGIQTLDCLNPSTSALLGCHHVMMPIRNKLNKCIYMIWIVQVVCAIHFHAGAWKTLEWTVWSVLVRRIFFRKGTRCR